MDSQSRNLVLLPGLDGTGVLFRPFSAALPGQIRSKIIAYPRTKPLSLSELADLVAAQLPSGDFVLFAESFSGLVALSLLGKIVHRVSAVVFCAAFAGPPRPFLLGMATALPMMLLTALVRNPPEFLLKEFCVGSNATPGQIALLREALSMVAPEVLAQRLALIRTTRAVRQAYKIPCYYIQPTEDRLVPPHCASWFDEQFEHLELKRIRGPHFLLQTKPEECAELVAKIISEF